MQNASVAAVQIFNVISPDSDNQPYVYHKANDLLAVEEPLEIRIIYGAEKERLTKSISVTMCTPGNDTELATGEKKILLAVTH
jgi:formate dehydrogenase assembly factor FdhD